MKRLAQHIMPLELTPRANRSYDRGRQAMANVRLEGLSPHPKTAALVQAVAEGKLNSQAAIQQICSWYAH